jgi:hypothetical protein
MKPSATDTILRELLADPAFRGMADAIPVDDDHPTTPAPSKVGDRLRLDQVKLSHRRRNARQVMRDGRGAANAAAVIGRLPKPGEVFHIVTDGSYTGAEVIPAIITLAGAPATEVIVSTLSFSRDNVDLLARLLRERQIRRLVLLANIYFRRTAGNEAIYTYAEQELDPTRATLLSPRVHAKITLLRTTNGRHIVIEGSANLRSCLSVEQLTITDDASTYRFHRRWLMHVARITQEATA